jgi:uncharacterized membrane protein
MLQASHTALSHDPRKQFSLGMPLVFVVASVLALLLFLPGPSVLARLQWLDSGICAQILSHSFYPGGMRLPLCARNTGIYLGFFVTLVTLYATGRGRAQQLPHWSIIALLACGVAALAVDGFNSLLLDLGHAHLYQPDNLLRLITGLATGLALALLFPPLLNRLFWCGYNGQRIIPSWRMFLLLLPALLACFFLVSSQAAWTLYPLAYMSTAGVLTMLSSLNMIGIVAASKRDETFVSYRELLPLFAIALLLAVGEMLLLAQGRVLVLHVLGV